MNTRTCPKCGTLCGPDDVFCENCGYDFITGSLPADGPTTEAEAPSGGDEQISLPAAPSVLDADGGDGADLLRLRLSINVDRAYFDEVVSDGEIDFPDPVPPETELELVGSELHIGRTSESRAIHPDIDVADLTGDQAVSSRHAVFRVAEDGRCTIVDVGSTNGTFLDAIDSEAIEQGVPVEVKPGTPIYLGAWTRLTILD
ncbi:MAG: FHA domain-containing protein [Actinomycetota bacterium]